jgi:hypothetical protein
MKILVFIGFILLGIKSNSQQYLNKTFVFDLYNAITTIFPTDSGYLIFGSKKNAVCLIDSQANIKWIKTYIIPSPFSSTIGDNGVPCAVHKNSNNQYIAGGTIQNSNATINKIYFIKFSPTFDTLLLKILMHDENCDGCLHIHNSFSNNNIENILIGVDSKDSSGTYYPLQAGRGLFLRLDSTGNIINKKLIGYMNNNNWFNCGLQMGNYYYLFGGIMNISSGSSSQDGWVVKTDLQGNQITSMNYGNPGIYDADFICYIITK